MKKLLILSVVLFSLFLAYPVYAHCPLCTVGAAGAAIVAKWLGIGTGPIGVFLGAFAVALGLWMNRIIKKNYVPGQQLIFAAGSFLLTILPLKYLFSDYSSIFISWLGQYGTTYLIDLFLWGSVIGGLIMIISPWASRKLTSLRKQSFAYQGIILTFVMLLAASVAIELWL